MYHKYGNANDCKHSKGRSMSGMDKDTVAVYAACKNTRRRQSYRSYFVDSTNICDCCDRYTPR